jgi:uncharacterized membrane protein
MGKGRLEAFTDGVIAIVITIMVLEIKAPPKADLAALWSLFPILSAYVLSFVNVGIFWNNHHHMLQATARVDGRVLWANLSLLFWISLVPLVIRWIDEAGFEALPIAVYGVVLAMASISYLGLEWAIVACNGRSSALARAVGHDLKSKLSLGLYAVAIALAFFRPWLAVLAYLVVVLSWFVPDRRIESLTNSDRGGPRPD